MSGKDQTIVTLKPNSESESTVARVSEGACSFVQVEKSGSKMPMATSRIASPTITSGTHGVP